MRDYPDISPEAQDSDDKLWGTIAHLSTLLPLPLFSLLGPIIVFFAKGDESYFAKRQAVSALNFQLTVHLAYLVCVPLMLILIGFVLAGVVSLGSMVLTFIAGITAYDGKTYIYPMSIRFFG
jgi:hypothetical protein